MESYKTIDTIFEEIEELEKNLVMFREKGNKAAAKRARKGTSNLEKLFKLYRKQSVGDCKPKSGGS